MIRCRTTYSPSFIAGFLEGDGTILHQIRKGGDGRPFFRPIIRFCNDELWLLNEIEHKLGKGQYHSQSYESKNCRVTHYLSYDSQKRVKPIADMLSQSYLSPHRQQQLRPILDKLNIQPRHAKSITLDWIRGFAAAEGCASWSSSVIKFRDYRYLNYLLFQKDPTVLKCIQGYLKDFDIQCRVSPDGEFYRLVVGRLEDVEKFRQLLEVE